MAADINLRVEITGAEQAKQQLEGVTAAGTQAAQRIQQAGQGGAQGIDALNTALARVNQNAAGLQSARQSLEATGTAAGSAGTGMQRFGQVMGQAGYQVQDFAVQVSAGQSALVALGQQGSQLLGVFGVGGAIAGAALTVGVLAAQMMGAGESADTLSDAVKGVEEAFKRVEAQAERRERWMEREAEAVNRLASEYRNMGLAQARAESLLVERQGASLDAEAVRMQGALRGAAGNDLNRRMADREVTNQYGAAWIVPAEENLQRLAGLMAELPTAAGRTAEVLRQIATESQNMSRSGDQSAASLVNLRNRAMDLLPAATRLDEAQRNLAVQTIAFGQAMGLNERQLDEFAGRFGQLAREIRRAGNELHQLNQRAIGLASREMDQQIADNNAVILARVRGGVGLAAATDDEQSRRNEVLRVQARLETGFLEELAAAGIRGGAALEELNQRSAAFAAQAEAFVTSTRGRAAALQSQGEAARTASATMSEAESEYQQILRQSEAAVQRTLSAEEQRAATIQRLSGFLREGALSQQQYEQGVQAVNRAFEAQAEQQRQRDADRAAQTAQRDQERAAERAQREADSFAARWGDRLADATTQALFDGFQRGQSFAQTMANTLRQVLRQAVSAALSQMVFQPMVGSITSAITGGPVGGQAGMTGLGGIGSFGGIGSLGGMFNGGMVNTSWSGLNNALNTPIWGGGASNVTSAPGAAGDGGSLLAHSTAGSGATWGNALGAAGYAMGGIQGFMRGGVGGTIQGVGNSIAAVMAMTPAAPFAPFVSMGSNLIGALIPEAPPRGFMTYGINSQGRLSGLGDMWRRTKSADRQRAIAEMNQYLAGVQAQLDQFGITWDTANLRPTEGVDTVWSGTSIKIGDWGSGDHLNPGPRPEITIPQALREYGRSTDPAMQRILNRPRAEGESSLQSIMDDANFVRSVYNPMLDAATKRLSDFARQVQQLVGPMDAAIDNSRKLGLATEDLVAMRERELAKLIDQRNTTLNGFWETFSLRARRARGEDGVDLALTEFDSGAKQEVRALQQQLESLGTTAAETAEFMRGLEMTQAEERLAVQRRFAEESVRIEQQRGQAIRDWLAGQRSGTASGLSPTEALTGARGEFTRDLRLAGLGDENALSRITSSADALLGAGRDVYASGAEFQALRDSVLASLDALPATQRIAMRESAILAANSGNGVMGGSITAPSYREPDWSALNRMATGIEDIRAIARELATTARELATTAREIAMNTSGTRDEVAAARIDARLAAAATRLGAVA